MWLSVRDRFRPWITGKGPTGEGKLLYMHKDRAGRVTIGIGNKIESKEGKIYPKYLNPKLYKHRQAGLKVTRDLVEKDFNAVKNKGVWKNEMDFESITMLRLTENTLTEIFNDHMEKLENSFKRLVWFKDFEEWPADAQMALLGLGWGLGANGTANLSKAFREACQQWDFATAAENCHYVTKDKQGHILPESYSAKQRKADIKDLFYNAAYALHEIIEEKPDAYASTLIFDKVRKKPPVNWKPPTGWRPPVKSKSGCTMVVDWY